MVADEAKRAASRSRCEPIEIPLCKDIPYKYTYFPNSLPQPDQQSLQTQTEHFKPLIKTKCNPHIKFFVCSVFAPMCPEHMPQAVTSCRSVCEEVKRDCVSILEKFGIEWPEPLNCSRFPQAPDLCMKPTNEHNSYLGPDQLESEQRDSLASIEGRILAKWIPTCPNDLVNLDPTDRQGHCAFQCNREGMFDESKKEFARFWMLLWASINLAITTFTVLTFLIDRQRFRFPERSIFYLSACYMLFSLPSLSRAFITYERSACERIPTGQSFLIIGTLDNTPCVISFILTYYFSMASSLWWLMLTFTWYLSAARKWVPEGIDAWSSYLHLVAWALPALLTIAVLTTHKQSSKVGVLNRNVELTGKLKGMYLSAARKWVPEGIDAWSSYLHLVAWALPALLTIAVLTTHKLDASELTGVCSVGNADPWALLGFAIAPKLIFVLVGSCLIVAGFSSMCRERDSFRRRGTDTSKLEKLMVKMGIFSALYIIPAITMVVCDSYHMFILMQWHPTTIACKQYGGAEKGLCKRPQLPQAELYILNIFMSLAVGISTGMWTLSSKTFHSWQRVLCCGLCSAAPAKHGGSLTTAAPLAVSRPLIPAANPPPPPHHYMPMTVSSVPAASHAVSSQPAWKQSKIV
ncbi:Frizzled-10 [Toxocara canis]|uniref:Frizzled-10 n=1 Tax=Toxocara canis TaxID=6265 RepID=A0A0B2VHM5_TOXCA|nr:Frizzled-10 [Toxocara canis]